MDTSSGESPMCLSSHRVSSSSQAPAAAVASAAVKQAGSSKISPAQRQGPCGHCKTPYSPQWRKGPRNKPVLCNACGIRFLRNRHLGRTVVRSTLALAVACALTHSTPDKHNLRGRAARALDCC